MPAPKCSPPKSIAVKSYWRAPRRKKRTPAGEYFVAENAAGTQCGHHHKTWSAAHACAVRHNRAAGRKHGRKAATWLTERK